MSNSILQQTATEKATHKVLGKVGNTSLLVVPRSDVEVDTDGGRLGVGLVLLLRVPPIHRYSKTTQREANSREPRSNPARHPTNNQTPNVKQQRESVRYCRRAGVVRREGEGYDERRRRRDR